MELRDLRYFGVLAEQGNLRRAAEALNLSTPALSKSLRRLEDAVGARLAQRTPKGIELTAVGLALVAQARRVTLTMSDVVREATDLSQGLAGSLRIGVSPALGEKLPALCGSLIKSSPKLTIQVLTSDNDVTLPMLLNGKLDLVFNYVAGSLAYDALTFEHVYDEVQVVCASARHRLAKRKTVAIQDLVGERWAITNPALGNTRNLSQAFQDQGLPGPLIAMETRSLRLRLQTIACTDLLGYIQRSVLRQVGRRFRLVELPIKTLEWRRPVGLIYRRDSYLSPPALRFSALLKRAAQELPKLRDS